LLLDNNFKERWKSLWTGLAVSDRSARNKVSADFYSLLCLHQKNNQ